MILKLNSMAEFMMWHMSALFENVGTIQDGMQTLGKKINIQDKPDAKPLAVTQGEIVFKDVTFAYNNKNVIDHFNLHIKAGEKIGIVVVQVQVNLPSSNYFYTFTILKKVQF